MEKKLHMEGLVYQNTSDSSRINKARAVKSNKDFQPTWHQVWVTGYDLPTGSHKKGIYQMKLSDLDKKRLQEVQQAVADGELGAGVTDLKKFNKSHALRLNSQLVEERKGQYIKDTLKHVPSNYHSINTYEDLIRLVDMLRESTVIALDTETTGLHYENDTVVGMSLTLPEFDYNCYIPFLHENSNVGEQLDKGMVMEYLNTYINIPRMTVIMFNAKFDMHMLIKDGLTFDNCKVYDALVGMKLLNENEPSYQLKKLVNKWGKYFGVKDDSLTFEELFSKDPVDFYKNADYRLCWYYACKDTDLTWKLWTFIEEQLAKHEGLAHSFYDIEVPILKVSFIMECNGMLIDKKFAAEYGKQLKADIADLDSRIKEAFGDINWNSPVQVKDVLYEKMGLKPLDNKKSTDAHTLKVLARDEPRLQMVLEYREKNKLYSSFIEPIPQVVWKDGRVHSQFNADGTKTGRFASKDVNLQNIPYPARPMFVAPEGKLIISADLKQIEPRTLSHLSKDPDLQKSYIEGGDLYVDSALKVYGKRYNMTHDQFLEVDDETWRTRGLPKHPRKMLKQGLLATIYSTSAHGLHTMLDISVEDGQQFIDDFHENFPVATKYAEDSVAFVDMHGYCLTMNGRKRRFPEFNTTDRKTGETIKVPRHTVLAKKYRDLSERAERILGRPVGNNVWQEKDLPYRLRSELGFVSRYYNQNVRMIVNAQVQGSAAEILKLNMIAMQNYLESKGPEWKMIATIHDEVLIEVPQSITEKELHELGACMTEIVKLDVPLGVDIAVMRRWSEDATLDEFFAEGYDCFDERGFVK